MAGVGSGPGTGIFSSSESPTVRSMISGSGGVVGTIVISFSSMPSSNKASSLDVNDLGDGMCGEVVASDCDRDREAYRGSMFTGAEGVGEEEEEEGRGGGDCAGGLGGGGGIASGEDTRMDGGGKGLLNCVFRLCCLAFDLRDHNSVPPTKLTHRSSKPAHLSSSVDPKATSPKKILLSPWDCTTATLPGLNLPC